MAENIKPAQSAPAAEKLRFFGLGKMKPFLKPHIAKFAVMVVFTLIVGGLQVILPLFQQYAIDHFIAEKTTEAAVRHRPLHRRKDDGRARALYLRLCGRARSERRARFYRVL